MDNDTKLIRDAIKERLKDERVLADLLSELEEVNQRRRLLPIMIKIKREHIKYLSNVSIAKKIGVSSYRVINEHKKIINLVL